MVRLHQRRFSGTIRMAIEKINLRKLLQLFTSDAKMLSSILRRDIAEEQRKKIGEPSSGGDFYVPLWAAARQHAKGTTNLAVEIPKLVAANGARRRLYPLLAKGFTDWWNEKRAWRNEPFAIDEQSIKTQHLFSELGLTVKVENFISGKIGEEECRLVYPYFYEKPTLSLTSAKIGIFILSEALPHYPITSFRILDVLRGVSYSINDVPFNNNEAAELASAYQTICSERAKLVKEDA